MRIALGAASNLVDGCGICGLDLGESETTEARMLGEWRLDRVRVEGKLVGRSTIYLGLDDWALLGFTLY